VLLSTKIKESLAAGKKKEQDEIVLATIGNSQQLRTVYDKDLLLHSRTNTGHHPTYSAWFSVDSVT
jgi:hypothetical protein